MFSNPSADAVLQLSRTTAVLASLRQDLSGTTDPDTRSWLQDEIFWHEHQLFADEQKVRTLCLHVFAPAGMRPDDERACARCGAPE